MSCRVSNESVIITITTCSHVARTPIPNQCVVSCEVGRVRSLMPRKSRLGSLDFCAEEACTMSPGPMTQLDIFRWPLDQLCRLRDYEHGGASMWLRFLGHMQRGIIATSEFSGWDSQAEATRLMRVATEELSGEFFPGFLWLRSSDTGNVQRHVLREISTGEGGHMCVLGDVNMHVDAQVRQLLDAEEPKVWQDSQAKRSAYALQRDILFSSSIAFPSSQLAWCFQHRCPCPVNLLGAHAVGLVGLAARSEAMEESCPIEDQELPAKRPRRGQQFNLDTTASGAAPWWRVVLEASGDACSSDDFLRTIVKTYGKQSECEAVGHEPEDDLLRDDGDHDATVTPLLATWGSTICTAYSPLGPRRTTADQSERPHNVFVGERSHRCRNGTEDLFWHENSHCYPVTQKQAEPLGSTHEIISIKADGTMLGYPYHRPRTFSFGFRRDKFQWVGSQDVQSEFQKIFARSVQLTGDEYFVANDDDVDEEYTTMAARRGYTLQPGFAFNDIDVLTKVCAPGTMSRMAEWAAFREDRQSLSGVYIADLDHHPGTKGPVSGPFYPTAPTHSTTYSFSKGRLHLGKEGFAVHGLHVYGELSPGPKYNCKFADVLQSLTRRQQELLVGNSLFCPAVVAWLAYCLGNLVCRTDPVCIPLHISGTDSDSEDDLAEV